MPRPKKITTNNGIMLSSLDVRNIENNDCLSIEIHISDLDERMVYLIQNFYKCKVTEGSFIIKTSNSWKGFIHFLISIIYCKVGGKIAGIQARKVFNDYITVGNDFKSLQLMNKQANAISEQLLAPKSFRPIYVRSNYVKNNNISEAIIRICKVLKIDTEKSKATVTISKNKIKQYLSKPIQNEKDIQNLICAIDGYLDRKIIIEDNSTLSIIKGCGITISRGLDVEKKMERFNTGVAFISKGDMTLLMDKYSIIIADPIRDPQQMKKYNQDKTKCTRDYKFLAYPILKEYEEQLLKHFPLCENNIKEHVKKADKYKNVLSMENRLLKIECNYIITDFICMGKWG